MYSERALLLPHLRLIGAPAGGARAAGGLSHPEEGQKVGVDRFCLRRVHTVREALEIFSVPFCRSFADRGCGIFVGDNRSGQAHADCLGRGTT
jgi:hypothetical protein